MSTQDIQQLIDFISQSGLDEVNIETTDLKISVKRYGQSSPTAPAAPVAPVQAPAAQPQSVTSTAAPAAPVAKADTSNYITIKAENSRPLTGCARIRR